jgi:acyl-CoA synthetase (AMP-forming)/AMP-acid ligase II
MCNLDAIIAVPKAQVLRWLKPSLRAMARNYCTTWFPFSKSLTSAAADDDGDVTPVAGDTPALFTFTSGSTGQPKCAIRSHGLLMAQQAALAQAIDLHTGQVDFATLPIFALSNLAAGVTTVLDDFDAPDVTRIVAAPAFFQSPQRHTPDSRRLTIYTGGAPLYAATLDRITAHWPSARVVAVYGSTEAEPIAHFDWTDLPEADRTAMRSGRGLQAGSPVPQVSLRILPNTFGTPIAPMTAADFAERCLGQDQAGEVVVTGDHVLKGYLDGIGDTETKFRVDDQVWHRTGDAGYLDELGRLWLLGRASARIEDAGGVLYPFQAESLAYESKSVRRCALVSHRSERTLVVEAASDLATTLADLKTRLAPVGVRQFLFVTRIPLDRRHRSKIDYPALARLISTM